MYSFMNVSTGLSTGVTAEYKPERPYRDVVLPASVDVNLAVDGGVRAWLSLTIEDARALAEALPQILMLHDAAERLAAEKAVA